MKYLYKKSPSSSLNALCSEELFVYRECPCSSEHEDSSSSSEKIKTPEEQRQRYEELAASRKKAVQFGNMGREPEAAEAAMDEALETWPITSQGDEPVPFKEGKRGTFEPGGRMRVLKGKPMRTIEGGGLRDIPTRDHSSDAPIPTFGKKSDGKFTSLGNQVPGFSKETSTSSIYDLDESLAPLIEPEREAEVEEQLSQSISTEIVIEPKIKGVDDLNPTIRQAIENLSSKNGQNLKKALDQIRASMPNYAAKQGEANYTYKDEVREYVREKIKSLSPVILQDAFTEKTGNTFTIKLAKGTLEGFYVGADNLFDSKYLERDEKLYQLNTQGKYESFPGQDSLLINNGDSITVLDDSEGQKIIEKIQQEKEKSKKLIDGGFSIKEVDGENIYTPLPDTPLAESSLENGLKAINTAVGDETCKCPKHGKYQAKKSTLMTSAYLKTRPPEEVYSLFVKDNPSSDYDHVFQSEGNEAINSIFRLGVMGKKNQPYIKFKEHGGIDRKDGYAVLMKPEGIPGYYFWNGTELEKISVSDGFEFSYVDKEEAQSEINELKSKQKDFQALETYTDEDYLALLNKTSTVLGANSIQAATIDSAAKALLDADERGLLDNVQDEYNQWRKQNAKELSQVFNGTKNLFQNNGSNTYNHEYYEAGTAIDAEAFGTVSKEPNKDGTYNVKIYGSEAQFLWNPETNMAIVKNRGEGRDLHFPMEEQSQAAITFFSYLGEYGGTDALDQNQVGEEDLSGAQISNRFNDLFPAEGSTYFRPGQMKEIANTLFYMKGKSIFWLLNHLSVQQADGNEENLVNNKEGASAVSRAELNVNAMQNNRVALLRFLEDLGDKVINSDTLYAHTQKNKGQILIDKNGSLVSQATEAV